MPKHLLLALLDNDSAVNALKACGADIIVLRKELEEYIEQHTPKLGENTDQAPHPTESFDRILQRAIFHVQSSGGDRTVEGADILVAGNAVFKTENPVKSIEMFKEIAFERKW